MALKRSEEEIKKRIERLEEYYRTMTSPVHQSWYGEDDLEEVSSDDGSEELDYPGPERRQYFCEHEYVNVSFTGIKLVCKFCDKEKEG